MKDKKDTKFWLNSFFKGQAQITDNYKYYEAAIKSEGCLIVNEGTDSVRVYTPGMAFILLSNELPAGNDTKIKGWEYRKTYIEAFNEGVRYFEKEFPSSFLYGANAERYVRDIHLNYYHFGHTGENEGWKFVKRRTPYQITHKIIKEYGYYSGIVSKVEEMKETHPKMFQTFDKCEHQQTETQTDKITATALGLFCYLINDADIIKRGIDETAGTYCKRICEKYGFEYKDRIRQNFYGRKYEKHIKKLTELIFPRIDTETKSKIQQHLDSKKTPKQNLYG